MREKATQNNLIDAMAKREYHYTADLPTTPDPSIGTVLVTGASGYIGGRLIPELLSRGYRVRIMVRGWAVMPWACARWQASWRRGDPVRCGWCRR